MEPTEIPKYKFTYFPGRGRGEFIRYMFALAEVPYEEELVQMPDWPARKPHTPFNTLPVLEINNGEHVINQSLAIGRFLAKRFGMAGRNAHEQALADQYVEGWADIIPAYVKVARLVLGGDMDGAKEAYRDFKEETLETYLNRYQRFLNANPAHSGWFVGDRVTWADLAVGEFLDRMRCVYDPDLLKDFPDLERFLHKLNNLPGIKRHIETRPDYKF